MSEAQSERAAPKAVNRPLSPHALNWRWHLTMMVSIGHRVTGCALYFAAIVVAGWALALASGPEAFDRYRVIVGSPLGKLVLIGITFSLFFHLVNGIRHLFWDFGAGFKLRTANATAAVVVIVAVLATIGLWAAAGMMGALS